MADLTPFIPAGRQVVEHYRAGGFRVSGVQHQGSVLVTADRTVPWDVAQLAALDVAALVGLIGTTAAGIELVLLGCGDRVALLPAAARAAFKAAGLAVEPMATAAACRTYNVLMAEGRPVAAALIAL